MTNLITTFSALADETRFYLVEQLMTQGELPAGDLVAQRPISGPAVSRHLKILRQAGVVQQRIDGTRRLYSVRPESLKAISDWTIEKRAFWQAGLDRLETLLDEEQNT